MPPSTPDGGTSKSATSNCGRATRRDLCNVPEMRTWTGLTVGAMAISALAADGLLVGNEASGGLDLFERGADHRGHDAGEHAATGPARVPRGHGPGSDHQSRLRPEERRDAPGPGSQILLRRRAGAVDRGGYELRHRRLRLEQLAVGSQHPLRRQRLRDESREADAPPDRCDRPQRRGAVGAGHQSGASDETSRSPATSPGPPRPGSPPRSSESRRRRSTSAGDAAHVTTSFDGRMRRQTPLFVI